MFAAKEATAKDFAYIACFQQGCHACSHCLSCGWLENGRYSASTIERDTRFQPSLTVAVLIRRTLHPSGFAGRLVGPAPVRQTRAVSKHGHGELPTELISTNGKKPNAPAAVRATLGQHSGTPASPADNAGGRY